MCESLHEDHWTNLTVRDVDNWSSIFSSYLSMIHSSIPSLVLTSMLAAYTCLADEPPPLTAADFTLDYQYGSRNSRVEKLGENHFAFHRGKSIEGDDRTSTPQFEIHRGIRGRRVTIDFHGLGAPSWGSGERSRHNKNMAYSLDGRNWTPVLQEVVRIDKEGRVVTGEAEGHQVARVVLGPFESDSLYYGWQIPLSHEMAEELYREWAGDPRTGRFLQVNELGKSIGGRTLYRLEITDPESDVSRSDRWVHWVSSAHPHEGKARWRVAGLIDWLLSDDPAAADSRRRSIWHVTIMMNPDGVNLGFTRINLQNIDMNRAYRIAGSHPSQAHEAYIFQREVERIMASNEPLTTFTDMHVWGGRVEPMIQPGPEFGRGPGKLGEWTDLREIMKRHDPKGLYKDLDTRSGGATVWDGGVHRHLGITASLVEGGGLIDSQADNMEAGRIYGRSYSEFYRGTKRELQ